MKKIVIINNNYVLHQDNTYVMKEKQKRYPSLYKIKILEITSTSILIENLGIDIVWSRMTHETFHENWEVIEQIDLIPIIDYTNLLKLFSKVDEESYFSKPTLTINIKFNYE